MEIENNSSDLHFSSRIDLSPLKQATEALKQEISKVIVGQEDMIDLLMTAILANGHVLLQGVPGVAKTLSAKLLAKALQLNFSRIQFTPDLMPSDVIGVSIFNNKINDFEFKKGPVFGQIILIDEINRSPAKTQAALFEVMEERQITVDGHKMPMQQPFLVLATQNPIEQEGTYRLPEAQLDRFLFLINIDYPSLEEEIEIIARDHNNKSADKLAEITAQMSLDHILQYQQLVTQIIVEPQLIQYIASIVHATRNSPYIYLGASPRASIAILKSAKAYAALQGRDFVTPEDIKKVAYYVLNHRIIIHPDKEMEGITAQQIIDNILQTVEIPH